MQKMAGASTPRTHLNNAMNCLAKVEDNLPGQVQDVCVSDQDVHLPPLAQHVKMDGQPAEAEDIDVNSSHLPPCDTAIRLCAPDQVQTKGIDSPSDSMAAPTTAVAAATLPSATQAGATDSSAAMRQQCRHLPLQPAPRQLCQQWIGAAKAGDLQILQRLYQQCPSLVNHQPPAGLQCSALHWAAANGHEEVMQQLLQWGADPSLLTATGSSCLHSAAAANRQECVELLLKVPQVLQHIDLLNEDGLTAAGAAGQHGHKVVQGMLLNVAARVAGGRGLSESNQMQSSTVPGSSDCALRVKQQQMTSSGLRPGFLNVDKASKRLLVDVAAEVAASDEQDSSTQHVKILHAQGSPHDDTSTGEVQDIAGTHAVTSSIGRGWLDAARRGDLPAMQSQVAEHPQLLQYCGKGTSYAFTSNTALHWSAAKGHVHVVQWLLQQGADVHCVNQAGETALHTAVGHGQAGCAEVLVLAGAADVHVQDGLGQSAAQVATAAGRNTLAANLLMWSLMRVMAGSDRSRWTVQQMQQMLRLAGRSADAAACVERVELVQLVQIVLQGYAAPEVCR